MKTLLLNYLFLFFRLYDIKFDVAHKDYSEWYNQAMAAFLQIDAKVRISFAATLNDSHNYKCKHDVRMAAWHFILSTCPDAVPTFVVRQDGRRIGEVQGLEALEAARKLHEECGIPTVFDHCLVDCR